MNQVLSLYTLLHLCLAFCVSAAPVADDVLTSTTGGHNAWEYGTGGGIIGLIVLILDIIVFIEVLQSTRAPISKLIWCLVVFLFPVIGMFVYWMFSNRVAHKRGAGYDPIP